MRDGVRSDADTVELAEERAVRSSAESQQKM